MPASRKELTFCWPSWLSGVTTIWIPVVQKSKGNQNISVLPIPVPAMHTMSQSPFRNASAIVNCHRHGLLEKTCWAFSRMALRLGVSEEGVGMPHGVWSGCTKDDRFILSKSIYVTCECIFVFYEYHTYIFQAPPSTLLWLTKFTNVFFQPLLERSRIKVIQCLNYHVIHILCKSTQPYVARSLQQWLGRSLVLCLNG